MKYLIVCLVVLFGLAFPTDFTYREQVNSQSSLVTYHVDKLANGYQMTYSANGKKILIMSDLQRQTMKMELAKEVSHNVLAHIMIVFNRAREFNDLTLLISAFMHDLGKVDKTAKNNKGGWSAINHELVSADLVKKYKVWINSLGVNWEDVYNIVLNHMRIQQIGEMRKTKQLEFEKNPQYTNLLQFTKFDSMSNLTPEEMNS